MTSTSSQPSPASAPAPATTEPLTPIAVARGASFSACVTQIETLAAAGARAPGDLPRLLAQRQHTHADSSGDHRVAIVADTPARLSQRARLLRGMLTTQPTLNGLNKPGLYAARTETPPVTAVLFSGQGTQYPNMLRALAPRFPIVTETLRELDAAYTELAGRPLTPAFWVEDAAHLEAPEEDVHCALFAANCIGFILLAAHGLEPDAALGQSTADIASLVASGVLTLTEGLEVAYRRQRAVEDLELVDPGRMIALLCPAPEAERRLRDWQLDAVVGARNSPSFCIVSAGCEVADALRKRCAAAGITAMPVEIAHAYHSRLLADAAPAYARFLETRALRPARCELVSSVTARSLRELSDAELRADLVQQLTEPVELEQAIRRLHDQGVRLFVECGPKPAVTTYVDQTLGQEPHLAIASQRPGPQGVEQLWCALACLWTQGKAGLHPKEP